jgi:hypothetical protein
VLTLGGTGTASITLNGAISDGSGAGGHLGLQVSGFGMTTLLGTNTYTGGTNVFSRAMGSSLSLASPDSLPTFTGLTIGGISMVNAVAHASNVSGSAQNNLFVSSLTLAGQTGNWTGKLDLANNDMVIRNGNLAQLANQVAQGFHNGAWNGSGGISSTTAASNSTHLTALGVIQNSTNQSGGTLLMSSFDGQTMFNSDVIVKYTYYGDANLDGKVDGSDYSLIDNGYLKHLAGWYNGDFNYDGIVNGSDYTLIDNAFNRQATGITSQIANPTAQFSVVPEPSTISIVSLTQFGAMARMGRRRKRASIQ